MAKNVTSMPRRPQSQGWHVYTLMKPDGGLPPVFVNRGWVPDTLKDPSKRAAGQVAGPVTVTGLIRLPEHKGWFTPDNDYAGNRWFSRDLDAMQYGPAGPPSPLQFTTEKKQAYAPFSIDADAVPEKSRRLAQGRDNGHSSSQFASAVRRDVVWFGADAYLRLCRIRYSAPEGC